jgi:hypothetical protein
MGAHCTWGKIVGVCHADGWFLGVKATTGAFPPGQACDPIGVWKLTYENPNPNPDLCQVAAEMPSFEVAAAPDGSLIAHFGAGATGSTATIGADGCSIALAFDKNLFPMNMGETVFESLSVSLTLAGNAGMGTYVMSEKGLLCGGMQTGPVTAARQ